MTNVLRIGLHVHVFLMFYTMKIFSVFFIERLCINIALSTFHLTPIIRFASSNESLIAQRKIAQSITHWGTSKIRRKIHFDDKVNSR